MASPTRDDDVLRVKGEWVTAKGNLDNRKGDIEDAREQITIQHGIIDQAEKELPGLEDKVWEAAQAVNELLESIARDIGLRVEAVDSSVVQGGRAKFRARIDEGETLPRGVEFFWDTGGCPIVEGTAESSEVIVVDTSTVGPGEYDISVSLSLTTT